MTKIKLSEIEKWTGWLEQPDKRNIEALCKAVRAAKLLFDLCEYDYGMDKTELTMLREALAAFDWSEDD